MVTFWWKKRLILEQWRNADRIWYFFVSAYIDFLCIVWPPQGTFFSFSFCIFVVCIRTGITCSMYAMLVYSLLLCRKLSFHPTWQTFLFVRSFVRFGWLKGAEYDVVLLSPSAIKCAV